MNLKWSLYVVVLFMSGCDFFKDRKNEAVQRQIIGNWERIVEVDTAALQLPPSPVSETVIERIEITKDSIESYLGFFGEELDSASNSRSNVFLGNKLPYEILSERVFIRDPRTGNRQFKWRFVARRGDTLFLTTNEEGVVRYIKRIEEAVKETSDFDQVFYSSSSCYGSCPIVDVSIDHKGAVLFHGERYVDSLGFYTGKVNLGTKVSIFNKFVLATPLLLEDNYQALRTDAATYTTTFIKNGRIVKTIHDYGGVAPKEMIWAYRAISTIYTQIPLIKYASDQSFYPKVQSFVSEKSDFRWVLEKSEGFFLWTELEKAHKGSYDFKAIYKLTFDVNDGYKRADPNNEIVDHRRIESISSDGRYYKFEFNEGVVITYDLGYNFVDRNWREGI